MNSRRLPEAGQEALLPAVDRAAVDGDAALGQPLDHVGVAQAVACVPPDGQGNDVVREVVPREGTGGAGGEPAATIAAAPTLPAQPRLPIAPRRPAPAPYAVHRQPPSPSLHRLVIVPPTEPQQNQQRYYPMRGFGSFASAARCCPAFEEQRQYFRTRTKTGERISLAEQRRLYQNRWARIMLTALAAA